MADTTPTSAAKRGPKSRHGCGVSNSTVVAARIPNDQAEQLRAYLAEIGEREGAFLRNLIGQALADGARTAECAEVAS